MDFNENVIQCFKFSIFLYFQLVYLLLNRFRFKQVTNFNRYLQTVKFCRKITKTPTIYLNTNFFFTCASIFILSMSSFVFQGHMYSFRFQCTNILVSNMPLLNSCKFIDHVTKSGMHRN